MSVVSQDLGMKILRAKLGNNVSYEITDIGTRRPATNRGMSSTQAHLSITARSNSGISELFRFFLKLPSDDAALNEQLVKPHGFSEKERGAFARVLPELLGNSLDFVTAKCYLEFDDCVVMDDLSFEGYEFPRVQRLNLDHTRIAFKLYAKFHAASIAAQRKTSDSIYAKHKDVLYECVFNENNLRTEGNLFKSTLKRTRYFVERYYQNKTFSERETVLKSAETRIMQLNHPSDKHLNVVCHGDAQFRNLLFKYDKETPIDVRLIDFGLIHYAPPVADLVNLLYTSTSSDFREKNETTLMSLYYDTLAWHLTWDYKMDVESILPRETFFESCEEYKEYGSLIDFFVVFLKFPSEFLRRLAASNEAKVDYFLRGGTDLMKEVCDSHEGFVEAYKQSVDKMFELYATKKG